MPARLLPARALLSRLFRRLFLEGLAVLHAAGRLAFHGDLTRLADAESFAAMLAPLRRADWVVYAKRPFGGPEAVLAYLARSAGKVWRKTMTLTAHEFIRRFLLHILPDGFHRIRHYGLLASSRRAGTIARIRKIIPAATPAAEPQESDAGGRAEPDEPRDDHHPPCPCCGGRRILVERFAPGAAPHTIFAVRFDTS